MTGILYRKAMRWRQLNSKTLKYKIQNFLGMGLQTPKTIFVLMAALMLILSPVTSLSSVKADENDPFEELVNELKEAKRQGFPISDEEIELAKGLLKNKDKDFSKIKPNPQNIPSSLREEDVLSSSSTYYVTLGYSTIISRSEFGRSGIAYSWGVPIGFWGADYILTENKGRAAAIIYPSIGGVWPYAWVGVKVVVLGSGSQVATITINGRALGYIWYAAPYGLANADAIASFVVEDVTAGTGQAKIIFDAYNAPLPAWYWSIDSTFSTSLTVNLVASHTYIIWLIIWLRLLTIAEVAGGGGSVADFGPQDGDYAGEGIWFTSINIQF